MTYLMQSDPRTAPEGPDDWGPGQWGAFGAMSLLFLLACVLISRTGAPRE